MSEKNNDKTVYSAADIQRYINGEMSAAEMHLLESDALEDPFLADAIEGYSDMPSREETSIQTDLAELHERIQKRVDSPERKITPFFRNSWWKIAAMILLVAGSSGLIYYLANNAQPKNIIVKADVVKHNSGSADSLITNNTIKLDSNAVAINDDRYKQRLSKPFKKEETQKKLPAPELPSKTITTEPESAPLSSASRSVLNDSAGNIASLSKEKKKISMDTLVAPGTRVLGYAKTTKEKTFSSTVLSADNKAVPNVVVTARTTNKQLNLTTDSNGYFKFNAPDTTASVVMEKKGFETTKINLRPDTGLNKIVLKQDTADKPDEALSEVVVSGFGVPKKSSRKPGVPQPEIGLSAYNRYLENNKKIPRDSIKVHGDVVISFVVNENGSLSDYKIEKSLSKQADDEALRLIKEGPVWKAVKNRKAEASVTVKF